MAEALRHGLMLRRQSMMGAAPMALLFLLPLGASLLLLLPGLGDADAFAAILAHPQFTGAMALTLWTGFASTALALVLAILIVSSQHEHLARRSGWFMAVPHLALALGLGFLIAPTGLLARLVATLVTGWQSPPAWQTVQDPHGFGLMLALVLKETPFLVWAMAQVLAQDELRPRFAREAAVARTLGHGPASAFARVVLPQILARVTWPIIAVFSYGLTVVDMALVIGPGQPPTLAQLLWTDLNDGDVANAARGAAGTIILSGGIMALLAALWLLLRALRPVFRLWLTGAAFREKSGLSAGKWLWGGWLVVFGLVIAALLLQSVAAHWPFPRVIASTFTLRAWVILLFNPSPFLNSTVLAVLTSAVALLACLAWFETQSRKRDGVVLAAAVLVLCLPALLLALGQYRLLLLMDWTGTWPGLLLAHLLFVLAYVFLMLQGPYRAYDQRWQEVSHGLSVARFRFLRQVKWPMLKAPLLSAVAIGFAVSVAQYVPSQLAAAGRISTLPIEAVTLSAGGNRALISVAALLLMALPLLAFRLAAHFGLPRWRLA